MNGIKTSRLNTEEDIRAIIEFCAPFFHNQFFNNKEIIKKLSRKFYNQGNVIIATYKDTPLGFCAYYANDYDSRCAFISMIIVISSAQGLGVGKELLENMVIDCRNKGMLYIRLEVANDNIHAIRFYERNKFIYERKLSDATCQYVLNL